MDNRAIGVFDSGLGGLTAVQALRELLPRENIIYFGDTARMPYGTKSVPVLRQMAAQDMDFLDRLGVKAIIAACGTVSSTAADVLDAFPTPVYNVLDASVETMAAVAGSAPLAVIATSASIQSGVFERRLRALCPGREILALPCQRFVTMIESGHFAPEDPVVQEIVAESLSPLKGKELGALLLGCTHFGFVAEGIRAYLGEELTLVSASRCAAQALFRDLQARGQTGGDGQIRYLTSGSREAFARLASVLLGQELSGCVQEAEPMKTEGERHQ